MLVTGGFAIIDAAIGAATMSFGCAALARECAIAESSLDSITCVYILREGCVKKYLD